MEMVELNSTSKLTIITISERIFHSNDHIESHRNEQSKKKRKLENMKQSDMRSFLLVPDQTQSQQKTTIEISDISKVICAGYWYPFVKYGGQMHKLDFLQTLQNRNSRSWYVDDLESKGGRIVVTVNSKGFKVSNE